MEQETQAQDSNLEVIASQLSQIESLVDLSGDRSHLETNEYKELKSQYESLAQNIGKGQASTKNASAAEEEEEETEDENKVTSKQEKPATKKEVTKAEEEEEEVEDEAGSKKKDVFGVNKGKETKTKLSSYEDMVALIEKKHSIKDPETFFKSVDKWRNDAQKYSELNEELEEVKEGLASLPDQIKKAINAYSRGEDWTTELTSDRIDYTQSFEKQKPEAILNFYYGEKFKSLQNKLDDEKITEEAYQEIIDNYLDSAKRLYETDKRNFENQRAEMLRRAEEKTEALKKSAISSVEKLKETFPGLKQSDVQRVRQVLINGNINSLFMDKDGKYAEDAAKKIALALNGDYLIELLTERAANEGKSKATEEIVFNAEKTVRSSGKNESPEKKQQIDAISHLSGLVKTDPYA